MESWENWLIAIPARLESTRLPEKPLADLGGKPLIIRVHEQLKDLKLTLVSIDYNADISASYALTPTFNPGDIELNGTFKRDRSSDNAL